MGPSGPKLLQDLGKGFQSEVHGGRKSHCEEWPCEERRGEKEDPGLQCQHSLSESRERRTMCQVFQGQGQRHLLVIIQGHLPHSS